MYVCCMRPLFAQGSRVWGLYVQASRVQRVNKVNHHSLYLKLVMRNVPHRFLMILIHWYSKWTLQLYDGMVYMYFLEQYRLQCQIRRGVIPYAICFLYGIVTCKLGANYFGFELQRSNSMMLSIVAAYQYLCKHLAITGLSLPFIKKA